ncbi:hypothetical protein ACWKWU_06030 [Chitinophaga lutea]
MKRIYLLALLAAACQSGPQKSPSDSTIVDATKALVPVAPAPDSGIPPATVDELTAPDTLFADGSKPADWDASGFTDPTGFKRFLLTFKDWIRTDNKDSILAHVRFPLPKYKTSTDLLKHWDHAFSPKVKKAVADQRLNEIFRNQDGAMIGSGELWFTQTPNGYRIIAINE